MRLNADSRWRNVVLWTCTGLFAVRVIGQIEVLLLAPDWLPPMDAWYSGLLPYPLLLPLQLLILMWMAALNTQGAADPTSLVNHRWRGAVRAFALIYCGAMLLRLGIQRLRGAMNLLEAGGIPVALHCVLALYLRALTWERGSSTPRIE
jgi:hypothetical protein